MRRGEAGRMSAISTAQPAPSQSALPGPSLVRSRGAVDGQRGAQSKGSRQQCRGAHPVHPGVVVDVARGPTRTPCGNWVAKHGAGVLRQAAASRGGAGRMLMAALVSVLDRWIWLWMRWSRVTSNQRAVEADVAAVVAP